MDNTSLCDIIERIPELKFRYIGSFPTDFVLNLPKFSFAIFNNSPSSEVCEHWIMIGRLNRKYFYADSLARSVTHYKLLNKISKNDTQTTPENAKLVWVPHSIYAAFLLFKLLLTNLNNVHDVHVLNFISNYM